MKLHIVTGNSKKFTELSDALGRHDISCTQVKANIDELQENDPRVIITDKVRKAYAIVDGPVLVDDSGIYFEKYNSFPGPLSKHVFYGIGYDGLFSLVKPGDKAWFHAFVAYMDEELANVGPQIFDAQYTGVITDDFERDEKNEMPFAPMFIPDDGGGKRMSDMTMDERSGDHRHQAVELFAQWFVENRT